MVRMPSWNIHTAHVERLLSEEDPSSVGIRDVNAFLFGNFVPDIYVGYMVQPISRKIPYRETHFADPGFVPAPDYQAFWRQYGWPSNVGGQVSDVVLGAWCHLMADHVYNAHTNAFLARHGIRPGEETRIRKQGDFDTWGRTLDISLRVRMTEALAAQCAAFPQYAIAEEDVRASVRAADAIVDRNIAEHIDGTPVYTMLNQDFFDTASKETDRLIRRCLHAYVAGDVDGLGGRE